LGIGGSFGKEIARCYSMRSAPMSLTSAPTPLLPVKLRLKPAPALFTRRFEAQLHWQPVVKVGRCTEPGDAAFGECRPTFSTGC
jgi:hypothetical protein